LTHFSESRLLLVDSAFSCVPDELILGAHRRSMLADFTALPVYSCGSGQPRRRRLRSADHIDDLGGAS